jgi:GMP synthase (glutamine-hydrolysing)
MPVLQSHGDEITETVQIRSDGFAVIAICDAVIAAAVLERNHDRFYGVQFHPEVTETTFGMKIFHNFCFGICGARDRYPAEDEGKKKIKKLRAEIGDKKVLLALSGGSDSSVVAHLLKHATKGRHQLRGVYIRGIDRPDDEAFVLKYFGGQDWIELVVIDATDRFLVALKGLFAMKEKRIAMRSVYKPVLEEQAAEFGASFIVQGTLYTDISESGGGHSSGSRKAQIKLHHNTNLGFSLPELAPLDDCVKDGARDIGRSIGVPEELLIRHPFPGPGLVVRSEGEMTALKLAMARAIDGIYIEELRAAGLYGSVWQAGAVVTDSVHTYTKGDDAGTGAVVALWAVWSVNGFTAQAAELPYDFLKKVGRRIGNEVHGIGAIVYRISDKPFSTIEWG